MPFPPLLLHPYSALAASIARHLADPRAGADPLLPWQEEVLVASGGVSAAVVQGLAAALPDGFAGLRLQSLESFALRLLNGRGEYPRVATPAERRLAMRTAARAVDDPLMETRGTAAMLERTYRDVRDSGLTLAAFLGRARGATLRNRERVRAMTRAWEEYERLIARLGATDPADVLARAATIIRSGDGDVAPQIVAGFYDMTGVQFGVVAALRDVEKLRAVHVPVDGSATGAWAFAAPFVSRFAGDAASGGAAERGQPPGNDAWTIAEHRTREDEARGVCSAIAAQLRDGTPAGWIGVVARSLEPYDVHLFDRFAREHGFAFTTRGTTPLIAHRIGRGVMTLLRLRERDFPRGDVLEIVRSGLRTAVRIDADKADAETRRVLIAGGTSAMLERRARDSYVLRDYVALVAELESLTARFDSGTLLRLVDQFRIDDASDLAAVQALEEIAAMFSRTDRWPRPADARSAIDTLEQAVIDVPHAADARDAVWLGDVMRLRGRTFDHLFAVRMQDDVLPQRRNEDPLLPDSDRRILGLREIGNGREEEALLFELMRGRQATHFSYAASDGFGKPLRPSQSLKAFAINQDPAKKTQILKAFPAYVAARARERGETRLSSPVTRHPSALRPLQLFVRAGTAGAFDGYVDTPLLRARTARALESVSPTHLEDFGECPQKFLLKHLLGVRGIDDPDREVQINHREKGIVDHRVLERFYRSTSETEIRSAAAELPRLPAVLAERLDTIIDEEFDALEEKIPAFNRSMRSMERRATKRLLRDFVAADVADLLDRDLLPSHFEYRFGRKHRHHPPDHEEPFIVESRGVAIRVEGTIDRIDTGHGRFRIVDYKSGKALRHTGLGDKIDRGVRLQLPLYALAVASFFELSPENVSGTIKPLVRGETSPDKFAFELAAAEGRLRETLDVFVGAITSGHFPAFPNDSDKDFQSCKYCPVNHSCRTRHDGDERRVVMEWSDPRSLLEESR